jgi:hypothetical protein
MINILKIVQMQKNNITLVLFLSIIMCFSELWAQPLSPVTPKAAATIAASPTLFQWNSKDNAANYKFVLASDSLFSSIIYQTTTSNLQTTNPIVLSPNNYFWRIIAIYGLDPNDTSRVNRFYFYKPESKGLVLTARSHFLFLLKQ